MPPRFFLRHKLVIIYGSALALLLFLLKWLEWRFMIMDHAVEIYSGAIAVVFTALGIWLALKLARPKIKTIIIEKEVAAAPVPAQSAAPAQPSIPTQPVSQTTQPNQKEITRLGLSARELEVLQLMAEGLSNQEIAGRLFLSLNTIKTHSSNIFEKLDVRRRTQAVEQARKLNIIA
jgi:two-component system, NarL family, response regulator LiaR